MEYKQSLKNLKNQNLQRHSSVRADDEGLESVSMISISDSLFKTRPEQTEIFSECASLKNSKTTNKADQSNQTKILSRHWWSSRLWEFKTLYFFVCTKRTFLPRKQVFWLVFLSFQSKVTQFTALLPAMKESYWCFLIK